MPPAEDFDETSSGELKDFASSTKDDLYGILGEGCSPESSASELRRAYRRAALTHHPDKQNNRNAHGAGADTSAEGFHLLQQAFAVLSTPSLRIVYDAAQTAREQRVARDAQLAGRRKTMVEELERREAGGGANPSLKRRGNEAASEEELRERQIKRLAEDGKRRRKDREQMLRRQREEERQLDTSATGSSGTGMHKADDDLPPVYGDKPKFSFVAKAASKTASAPSLDTSTLQRLREAQKRRQDSKNAAYVATN